MPALGVAIGVWPEPWEEVDVLIGPLLEWLVPPWPPVCMPWEGEWAAAAELSAELISLYLADAAAAAVAAASACCCSARACAWLAWPSPLILSSVSWGERTPRGEPDTLVARGPEAGRPF